MKRLILIITMVGSMLTLHAQRALEVATLSHADTISTYYGASTALIDAYNAAVDGDVISLSAGAFTAPDNIKKSISIYGVGYDNDSIPNGLPTMIINDIKFGVNSENTPEIYLEGLAISQNTYLYYNVVLNANRCMFNNIDNSVPTSHTSASFINCRVVDYFRYNSGSYTFTNSVIPWIYGQTGSVNLCNCVFGTKNNSSYQTTNLSASNCFIIDNNSGSYTYDSSTTFFHNVIFTANSDPLKNIALNKDNIIKSKEEIANVFSDENPDLANTECMWRIKDDILSDYTYTAMEGTMQLGIYGGVMPFGTVPANAQVKKFEADHHSTTDGKLNINIVLGN